MAPDAPSPPGSVADLVAAEYNPRRISPDAASGLRASLDAFGDVAGIVWNARSGRLVAGHQRIDQLRALHGDGLRLEDGAVVTPGGDRFGVRTVDWDEATERAANVAANNPHIAGEFTDDLGDLLDSIEADLPELFESVRLDELADALGFASDVPDPLGGDEPRPPKDGRAGSSPWDRVRGVGSDRVHVRIGEIEGYVDADRYDAWEARMRADALAADASVKDAVERWLADSL